MCLAIPAIVRERNEFGMGTVDIMGVTRQVSLDLVPDAEVDDYVLVHAGFAIEVVSEQFAEESLELIKQMPFLTEDLGMSQGQVDAMNVAGE